MGSPAMGSRLSVGQARIAAIVTGGAIGTVARAGVAEALPLRAGQWPWATFIVNLVGCVHPRLAAHATGRADGAEQALAVLRWDGVLRRS